MVFSTERPIKMLVVEDNKLISKGLHCIFSHNTQFQVTGLAESAEEGMRLIQRDRPDVAVIDLYLPGMDGIEMTRRIKAVYPHMKVIIYTTDDSEETVMRAMAAGANAYCLKGETPANLMDIVRNVFHGALWFDPMVAAQALRFFTGQGAWSQWVAHTA